MAHPIFDKSELTEADIQTLINNRVAESIHLDFKDARSIGSENGKKNEIAKDVSAFANSDGGVIVYGMQEIDHVASAIAFVDGNEFTKEWLEQVINSRINRRIPDILVIPVRFDSGDISKSIT